MSKSTSFTKDQSAEILHDERGIRLVRLDFYYGTHGSTIEILAELGEGLVTLTQMNNEGKPRRFSLDPNNMTRLAVAWLAFLDDCKAAEEQDKADYQAKIEATRERAKAVGAQMIDYSDNPTYGTFNLSWPATHPLSHINRRWTDNENLSLPEVHGRLKCVEDHMKYVQTGAVTDKCDISTFEQLDARAYAVDATLLRDAPGYYSFTFLPEHPFFGFWNSCELLTAGQVEYRLRYVEGVMRQDNEAKEDF